MHGPLASHADPATSASPHRWFAGREPWWLAFAVVLAYLPSLWNGFTNWDDPVYVTRNPLVAVPGFWSILMTPVGGNYTPLTIGSLALNHAVSGNAAWSYHALNLLLHVLNAVLVYAFVHRLTCGRVWTSVATAAVFGLHPMHVESVAWIAERKDVLCALFYLAALVGYLRYLDTRRRGWLAAVLGLDLLAMASKPMAIVLPLTLLAVDWYRERRLDRGALLEKLPFVAVSVAGAVLTLHAQGASGALERNGQLGVFDRLLFAGYGLAMYVVKLFAPVGLSALYPVPRAAGGALSWEPFAATAAVAVLLPLVVFMFRRRRAVVFGLAFFMIHLVLVLQVVTIGSAVMADRYTYLPYIGAIFALSAWLDGGPSFGPRRRAVVAGASLAVAVACMVLTWNRCGVWKDSETLWSDVIAKHPHASAMAYNNRGDVRRDQGRPTEALADFDESIAISRGHALPWINRGDVLLGLRRIPEAIASYDSALALAPLDPALADSPDLAYPLDQRGSAKLAVGDLHGAVADFSRSLELSPDDPSALGLRGLAYEKLGEPMLAVADWHRAMERSPDPSSRAQYAAAIARASYETGPKRATRSGATTPAGALAGDP